MPSTAIRRYKLGAQFSTVALFCLIQNIHTYEPGIVEIIWNFLSDMMKNCKVCLKFSKFSKFSKRELRKELRKFGMVFIPVFWRENEKEREQRERRGGERELVILPVPCTCKKCKTKKWLKLREEGRAEKRYTCRICRNPASHYCESGLCGECCINKYCTDHQHSFETRSLSRYKK